MFCIQTADCRYGWLADCFFSLRGRAINVERAGAANILFGDQWQVPPLRNALNNGATHRSVEYETSFNSFQEELHPTPKTAEFRGILSLSTIRKLCRRTDKLRRRGRDRQSERGVSGTVGLW